MTLRDQKSRTSKMAYKILVLNGPGLADLSDYDGNTYKGLTLDKIRDACSVLCSELGIELDFRQTEDQDEMFRWIAKDSEAFDGVIMNPVGYSRAATVAFPVYRSAIQMIALLKKPVVEVHINNIYSQSAEITQPVHEPQGDMGFVCGLGINSYLLGIKAIARKFEAGAVL
jgi:3-dehydroquinate dehydratase-2